MVKLTKNWLRAGYGKASITKAGIMKPANSMFSRWIDGGRMGSKSIIFH